MEVMQPICITSTIDSSHSSETTTRNFRQSPEATQLDSEITAIPL